MKETNPQPPESGATTARWPWWLATVCVVIVLVAIFLPRPAAEPPVPAVTDAALVNGGGLASSTRTARFQRQSGITAAAPTANEIVSRKLNQFVQNRRKLVRAFANHLKVEVPAEVEHFFDLAEAGNWEQLQPAFDSLKKLRASDPQPAGLAKLWVAVQETFGVAQVAHDWPAQKLLDYGEAVLGSLRPGMVYVGGTDAGRFIPTLLNETSEGERHIVLTQNAFADATYLDYVSLQYADSLKPLTPEDSQNSFKTYLDEAQKRLQQNQLRPGEDVKISENRMQVSGQFAVMAINEKLLQTLMDKNPDATFAIEQSFAFKSMYADTTPLGPIMELRSHDEQNALTPERATQSLDYWRTTTQQLAADPDTPSDSDPRKAYAKLAAEQAALLLDRKYAEQAEQIYRLANELSPTMPEAVLGYVELLKGQNRFDDALLVAENAMKAAPKNKDFSALVEKLKTAKK